MHRINGMLSVSGKKLRSMWSTKYWNGRESTFILPLEELFFKYEAPAPNKATREVGILI